MSGITSAVPTVAPSVDSFGAGGQMYMASMWTGFNVSAQVINPLFAISQNDGNVANAAQLTNLMEAMKVGSTMAFRADRIGFRVVSFKQDMTPDDLDAMKHLLASAVITITVGANQTKVAEFSGLDLMEPIDAVAYDDTRTCLVSPGLGGGIGWIPLQIPIEIQANVNVGGTVRFTRAVPAELTTTPNSFGFVVIMQGLKIVKS